MNPFSLTSAELIALLVPLIHIVGAVHALDAIMNVRTSQGAIAWGISLVTFPYVSIPLYWIFGRARLRPDDRTIKSRLLEHSKTLAEFKNGLAPHAIRPEEASPLSIDLVERLSGFCITKGNRTALLIDGQATFDEIFKTIEGAQKYVLLQFYIVRNDDLGIRLKELLCRKVREGLKIYFLYDSIGCYLLSDAYIETLTREGVEMRSFGKFSRYWQRFHLNFRNHRKLVLVDGTRAFVSGQNIGDEYLGRDPHFGHWRDTAVVIEGPAVRALQTTFAADWSSVTGAVPDLDWQNTNVADDGIPLLIIPSSPTDEFETNLLFFTHLIDAAKKRIWISSPYFVPDSSVINALTLASLRGVDVRVLIPKRVDHLLVYLASFSLLSVAEQAGIGIYRYSDGFLHQKVVLVDDAAAVIGTSNFDNRSFRLNFELNVLAINSDFASKVKRMLEADFKKSVKIKSDEYYSRSFLFRAASQLSWLLSPVL